MHERDSSETSSAQDANPSGVRSVRFFFFVGGQSKSVLPSPSRQMVDSALKPAFGGARAPGTLADGNVVHVQRRSKRWSNCVHLTVDGDCKQDHTWNRVLWYSVFLGTARIHSSLKPDAKISGQEEVRKKW